MRSNAAIIAAILGRSLVSIACCLVIGLIIFQGRVTSSYFWTSQIVMYAVIGSIFFFSMRVNKRNAFAVLLVLFVVQEGLLFRTIRLPLLLRDGIFFAALAAALYVFYVSFYTKAGRFRNLHPLVLATLFAIAFSLGTLVLGILDSILFHPMTLNLADAIFTNARFDFLVGLGIGTGVLLLDKGYVDKAIQFTKRILTALGATFREFGERL